MDVRRHLIQTDNLTAIPPVLAMRQCCTALYPSSLAAGFALELCLGSSTAEAGAAAIRMLLNLTPETEVLIGHDTRGAPLVQLPCEISVPPQWNLLISLTDEDRCAAALALFANADTPLCGVGIDLAGVNDFKTEAHAERFFAFILTEHELAVVHSHPKELRAIIACALFSAKEAAIKSMAPLVRACEQSGCDVRLNARFSELELQSWPDGGVISATGETAQHLRRMGVRELRCSIRLGHDYVFSAASCTIDNWKGRPVL